MKQFHYLVTCAECEFEQDYSGSKSVFVDAQVTAIAHCLRKKHRVHFRSGTLCGRLEPNKVTGSFSLSVAPIVESAHV